MPSSPRRFLVAPLLAGAFVVIAATPVEPPAGPFHYETKEIAPNVYGFFEKRLNPIVSSNIIAVIGTDATSRSGQTFCGRSKQWISSVSSPATDR